MRWQPGGGHPGHPGPLCPVAPTGMGPAFLTKEAPYSAPVLWFPLLDFNECLLFFGLQMLVFDLSRQFQEILGPDRVSSEGRRSPAEASVQSGQPAVTPVLGPAPPLTNPDGWLVRRVTEGGPQAHTGSTPWGSTESRGPRGRPGGPWSGTSLFPPSRVLPAGVGG